MNTKSPLLWLILLLIGYCVNAQTVDTSFFALEKKGWLLDYCDLPDIVNLDSVKKAIDYPPACKDARIEGIVVVRITVDTTGNILSFEVIHASHPALADAVMQKIEYLRFEIDACHRIFLKKFGRKKSIVNVPFQI